LLAGRNRKRVSKVLLPAVTLRAFWPPPDVFLASLGGQRFFEIDPAKMIIDLFLLGVLATKLRIMATGMMDRHGVAEARQKYERGCGQGK
jgi:hypothetical protein